MSIAWKSRKLGELCSIELGKTPSRSNTRYWDEKRQGNNVWLSIADLLNAEDGFVSDSKEYLSDEGAAVCKIVKAGTLLVSFKLTLGRLAYAGCDLITNEAIAALCIFDDSELSKEFLFYFLQFFNWQKAAENDVKLKGMTLNKAKLKEINVVFPPMEEQRRIISILDEAFEVIATAVVNAEKNLANAQDLFDGYLASLFNQRGKEWQETGKPLSEQCELIVDCEHKTAPTQDEGFPSIRTTNIGQGKLLLNGVNRVSEETYAAWTRRAVPQTGDLIFAREAPAGNVAVIPKNLQVCLGQRTVLIRPKNDVFDSDFLAFLLLSQDMQKKLLAHSKGATVQHINMKDIRALNVGAIPAVSVQRSIVEKILDAQKGKERLSSIYQQKLAALDELKKSILHRAFSGQLH